MSENFNQSGVLFKHKTINIIEYVVLYTIVFILYTLTENKCKEFKIFCYLHTNTQKHLYYRE